MVTENSWNESAKSVGATLELRSLSKIFSNRHREVRAVDAMNLVVHPGELLVLLGPSGCGKSTLLELLAGLEPPTSGSIHLGNRLLCDPSQGFSLTPKERKVAMVFQSYALYPHLTVRENIAFPLQVAGQKSDEIEKAIGLAAEAVQIENLLLARPAELSGGQKQRVAIARAMVRRPDLLLMDEPLSNLDARLRLATRAKIKALQRQLGVTTLYVTHDQQEAMALGDRVAILNQGRIEQIGTPSEIFSHPATAFAARFAGHPPMNLLRMQRSRDAMKSSEWVLSGTEWTWTASEFPGASLLLGIRPEFVDLLFNGDNNLAGLPAIVEATEKWGRDALIQMSVGQQTLTALISGAAPKVGEKVWACFEPSHVQLFPDDGQD